MDRRKKQIALFLLAVFSLLAYTGFSVAHRQQTLSNEDFIRFHVIANSDTDADQQLKLKVRDGVLVKVNADLAKETMAASDGGNDISQLTINQSRAYIKKHLGDIEKTAQKVIRENGYDYTAKATLGVRFIPQKTYGNVTFPAGNYEALNITIGEGKGHNWWCVLFPPLCLIGVEGPSEDYPEESITKDNIDPKYKSLMETDGKPVTLQLKFKTLEVAKKFDQ